METRLSLPMPRRRFLARAALGLAATVGTSVLAACSQPPTSSLVFSLNLIGDGLRDAIDPHRRRRV